MLHLLKNAHKKKSIRIILIIALLSFQSCSERKHTNPLDPKSNIKNVENELNDNAITFQDEVLYTNSDENGKITIQSNTLLPDTTVNYEISVVDNSGNPIPDLQMDYYELNGRSLFRLFDSNNKYTSSLMYGTPHEFAQISSNQNKASKTLSKANECQVVLLFISLVILAGMIAYNEVNFFLNAYEIESFYLTDYVGEGDGYVEYKKTFTQIAELMKARYDATMNLTDIILSYYTKGVDLSTNASIDIFDLAFDIHSEILEGEVAIIRDGLVQGAITAWGKAMEEIVNKKVTVRIYPIEEKEFASEFRNLFATYKIIWDEVFGNVQGSIIDAVTNLPLQDVNLQAVSSDGLIIKNASSEFDGTFELDLVCNRTYDINMTKDGYMPVIYENIIVEQGQTEYLETVLQIADEYSGIGYVSGQIVNAVDGEEIEGVTLELREGINVQSGTVVQTSETDYYGEYNLSLSAGHYTAKAYHSEFNSTYFTIVSVGGLQKKNINTSMSPKLAEGEIRTVLTWGASPEDLDSHLTGPIPGSSDRFHIYFNDEGNRYSSPYAFLDHDDLSGYGPETITIIQQFDGIYRYSVLDYSNEGSNSSFALSSSGAKVEIYQGSNLIKTFNVPTNTGGTLWTVFELENSDIKPINTLSYDLPTSNRKVISSKIDPIFYNFKFPVKKISH